MAVEGAHQIGHEDEASLQEADDGELASHRAGDLSGNFADPPCDAALVEKLNG